MKKTLFVSWLCLAQAGCVTWLTWETIAPRQASPIDAARATRLPNGGYRIRVVYADGVQVSRIWSPRGLTDPRDGGAKTAVPIPLRRPQEGLWLDGQSLCWVVGGEVRDRLPVVHDMEASIPSRLAALSLSPLSLLVDTATFPIQAVLLYLWMDRLASS